MASTNDTPAKKVLTLAEFRKLAEDKDKSILMINNHIYDVTRFLEEHPGGEEVLKEQHGRDASNAFEDVGHSSDAREQMKAYEIAQIDPNEIKASVRSVMVDSSGSTGGVRDDGGLSWTKWIIPLVIAIAAVVLFKLLTKHEPDVNQPPTAI
ncbi:unnamed protein product [Rotaria sp. Silwood2]|nr:unnamed protein product [Rotaria sp. Silwood2]CAF3034062.1 unnamed protein product [Rotaria sp. Silwood2]CAF4101869.1 unnamed protein product [Rotaria sp. Silwood2]CAF4477561.1 unnamed protein product [Rotaria sp. Silwood2]CAF4613654.1 unnamed protein product [Rotaria sp. Silwood2]